MGGELGRRGPAPRHLQERRKRMAGIWSGSGGGIGAGVKNNMNKINNANKVNNANKTAASTGGGAYKPPSSGGNNAFVSGKDDYGETDYSVLLQNAMKNNAPASDVQDLLNKRTEKAISNGYNQYAYDNIYGAANDYIKKNQNPGFQELPDRIDNTYAEIQRQEEAKKKAAVEQAVGGLNAQKEQVGQSYTDLFKQLYMDRRMAEKRLPQQMAAMGYTGGLTESSALNLQNSYANALRQGEQGKVNALSELDRAITDTRLKGDISIADLAAQNAKDHLASYTDMIKALQDQSNMDRQFGFQQDQFTYGKTQDQLAQENWLRTMSRQELLDQLDRSDLDYSRKMAAAQYLYEKSGDASGLRMLGYDDAQIQAMEKTYAAQQTAGRNYGGGGGGESKPLLTYSQIMDAINNGYLTPNVLSAYESLMGEPYQTDANLNGPITGYSQLGDAAKQIVARGAHPGASAAVIADAVERALGDDTITKAEADYILRSINY